jgi:hypothetical protein
VNPATNVTNLLHEGENIITVVTSLASPAPDFYLVAEIICTTDHDTVFSMPTHVSEKKALEAITSRLKSPAGGPADDDLVINQQHLRIDLTDPFTSTIWETPARTKNCQHKECFDLEFFMNTRRRECDDSCLTDPFDWKCPVCKKYAQPQMLVVDLFLSKVRQVLKEKNQLHARAIVVKEDGTWDPILERSISQSVVILDDDDDNDDDHGLNHGSGKSTIARRTPTRSSFATNVTQTG